MQICAVTQREKLGAHNYRAIAILKGETCTGKAYPAYPLRVDTPSIGFSCTCSGILRLAMQEDVGVFLCQTCSGSSFFVGGGVGETGSCASAGKTITQGTRAGNPSVQAFQDKHH